MFKKIKSYDYTHTTDFDFKALCELLAKEYHDLAIEKIKVLAKEVKVKNLSFDQGNYTRNIIINNADYWLGLLHWDQGATTRIHGHPEQAFVYVFEGELSCKSFDKNIMKNQPKCQIPLLWLGCLSNNANLQFFALH
jgi:hypothetical protein